jgi:RHS repeat-associated protein
MVSGVNGTTSYTYDAIGNRLTLSTSEGTLKYSYDPASRLLTAGSRTFTYDNNGNRLTKTQSGETVSYSYDAANRLVSSGAGTTTSTFSYDGDGNRVTQADGRGSYVYVNDVFRSPVQVLQETGPDGNISYVYGAGLISESAIGFTYFYHSDGLGSVIGMSDASGSLQQGYSYNAWGGANTVQGAVGTRNKFRFAGQALDPGTGLYFLRARYYDSGVSRFLTMDPVQGSTAVPLSSNSCIYARNNPLRYTDATGLTVNDQEVLSGAVDTACGTLGVVTGAEGVVTGGAVALGLTPTLVGTVPGWLIGGALIAGGSTTVALSIPTLVNGVNELDAGLLGPQAGPPLLPWVGKSIGPQANFVGSNLATAVTMAATTAIEQPFDVPGYACAFIGAILEYQAMNTPLTTHTQKPATATP